MRAVVLLLLVAGCSARESQPVEPARPPTPVAADAALVAPSVEPGLRLPAGARPLAYDLRLELDPARDTFTGHVEIRVRLDAPAREVWLHADALDIDQARYVAGTRRGALVVGAPTEHAMRPLAFDAVVPAGEVVLELGYAGRVGDDLEGLFRQKTGGKWFLYSQAEATFARRIVPCFDEPQHKVPWRVALVVPDGQIALANAPAESTRALGDGRREVKFAAMPALPPHLLAVAVGPFTLVDLPPVGARRVPVRAAVRDAKDAKRLDAARVWVPKLVAALEDYVGRPLPLAKLDLVAVPRFFGAMENPGLVTFEVSALVGDAANPGFLRRHVRFLAHELAHQWFGNALTPAWWDDLWLAEAFATWLDDKLSSMLGTLDDPALRTQLSRAHALGADRDAAARPLRRPIASTDDIEDAFDAISYEKGAAVLAMVEHYLGEAQFRDVIRAYIARDGTATARDFLAALERADAGLARAFSGYLDRAGAPIVELDVKCVATGAHVLATPREVASAPGHPPAPAIVPLCVRYPGGKACALADGATPIALAGGCPAWVAGNADGRGYYHVHWRSAPVAKARGVAIAHLTPAERLAHGEDRAAAVARGELATTAARDEVTALLATGDPYAELAAIGIAVEVDRLIAERDVPAWGAALAKQFARRLTRAAIWRPRTLFDLAAREPLLELVPPERFPRETTRRARELVDRALRDGPHTVHPHALVRAVALALPAGGRPLFDRIADAAAQHPPVRDAWFEGLGYAGAALAPRAVELVLDRRFEPARAWAVVAGMLARTATRDAAWRAVRARLGELLATLGAADAARIIDAAARLCSAEARRDVEAAFAPHVTKIADGKRALGSSLAGIARCITASAGPTTRSGP